MKIRIQPKEHPDLFLPYPYFINSKGFVGRQDFWKGKPYKLIGFSPVPVAGEMELYFSAFWKNPERVIGMYPVFANKKKNWFTLLTPIESIEKIQDNE